MSTRRRSPQQINAHYSPYLWPFAKLRNGFGSHRYIYSPILFDSQELILFYLSTRTSCHAGDAASPVTTIVPTLRWSPMENGDADLSSLAAGAALELW